MRIVEMDNLQATAASWLVRVQNDDLSVEEVAEWQQWLAAKCEHRQAFDDMQRMWQGFEKLPNKLPPALPRPSFRPLLAAAAIAALVVAGLGAWHLSKSPLLDRSNGVTVFETKAGEHREVTLPDGSQLALGAKSLIWIRFAPSERRIGLDRGEAFFTVVKDKARPFVVHAGEATITALGTAFNVRKSGERVSISVAQGAVKVQETPVTAGQEIIVAPSASKSSLRSVAPHSTAAWRTGRLEYLGEPLKYVVADVNRYSDQQITIGDPAVGELLLTGTVFEDDIDAWLRSVEDLLPLKVERPEPGKILLTNR
jgi:transmembrane sensor